MEPRTWAAIVRMTSDHVSLPWASLKDDMRENLSSCEAQRLIEAFLSPSARAQATHELASYGAEAIPVLRSIFDGKATNQFGVSYCKLGMPIDCALVVVALLGNIAAPLEEFIRCHLVAGHPYAESALAAIRRQA